MPAGAKFGPLTGQLLHTSYGTSKLFEVLKEEVGGEMQADDGRVGPRTTELRDRYWQRHVDPAWSTPVRYTH